MEDRHKQTCQLPVLCRTIQEQREGASRHLRGWGQGALSGMVASKRSLEEQVGSAVMEFLAEGPASANPGRRGGSGADPVRRTPIGAVTVKRLQAGPR